MLAYITCMLGTSAAMKFCLSSTVSFTLHAANSYPSKTRECDEVTRDPFVLLVLLTYNDQRNFSLAQGIITLACVY